MDTIKLVVPYKELEEEALAYRSEHFDCGETVIHGSSLFDEIDSYEDWLQHIKRNSCEETVPRSWVVSSVFFGVRARDQKIIGVIDLRHKLNAFLKRYGGHIGYAVRPSERGKGYATEMLRLMLEYCRNLGMDKAMICCYKDNLPSIRTLEKHGGILEKETTFTDGKPILVYWIKLTEHLLLDKGFGSV
ncbi:MAG: GNAT family N-acetyltransferase [Peptococcaceae bacterium]|nr:GNAT family N-acetyltransferase [Peptococcaceae bacterium]